MNASFLKFSYIPQHKAPFPCYSLCNARNLLFFTILYKLEAEEGDTFFIQTPLILLLFIETRFAPAFSMGAIILRYAATFFLLLVFIISDASIVVNPSSEAIQESTKLDYQESEIFFPPLTVTTAKDTNGDIPIVNPTIPGTTPIVNPITPQPPTTTGPPTTPTPTAPEPPATTTPTIPEPPFTTGPTTPGPPTTAGPTSGSWCIANAGASQTALQVALDYACGYGGADCSGIQPGGPCYEPSTLRDHASYAFNSYYQKNPVPTSCAFGGAAQLTTTDPSHGSCQFASSSSTPTTPPRSMTPTIPMTPTVPMIPMTPTVPMTPPSTTTPFTPYAPGGNGNGGSEPAGFDYGSEPTGTPSSAGNLPVNLLMLITMNCLILSVATANNF